MGKRVLIRLPWPDKQLSSNARGHWRRKADAVKDYRASAHWLAKLQHPTSDPASILRFTFHPPDRRKRDLHNMPHMMKAAIDGIADAMGVDDNKFRVEWPTEFSDVVKGGSVLVEVVPSEVEIPLVGIVR